MRHMALWELSIALTRNQKTEIVLALNRIYYLTGLVPHPETQSGLVKYASVLNHPMLHKGCKDIVEALVDSFQSECDG